MIRICHFIIVFLPLALVFANPESRDFTPMGGIMILLHGYAYYEGLFGDRTWRAPNGRIVDWLAGALYVIAVVMDFNRSDRGACVALAAIALLFLLKWGFTRPTKSGFRIRIANDPHSHRL